MSNTLPPLLHIQNVSLSFLSEGKVAPALHSINITINKNEIVGIVGESGSGKSVTSLSVLQLLPAISSRYDSGAILFSENGGKPMNLLTRSQQEMQQIRGNQIAMIFQEPMTSLNPVFTCGSQVMEALLQHKNISKQEARQQTLFWFEKVKLPDPETVFDKYPHQLSGGQKQRVMIAMAMCCEPALLICDEPTTALDVTVQQTVLHLIKDLQMETGMGVIFITHDLGVVAGIADRVIVMYKGSIVEEGDCKKVFTHPQHPYTQALLACRPANHPRGVRLPVVSDFLGDRNVAPAGENTPATISKSSTGKKILVKARDIAVWYPHKKNWLGKPAGYTKAIDEVSFDVYENETLGIVGESGCGKTTLGRAILQLIPLTSGQVIFNARDLALYKQKELRALRRHLQIVFQDPYSALNPRKKIGDAIAEVLAVHHIATPGERRSAVTGLLEKVGLLPEHFERYPHEFSGGQRQRIVIARALALRPSFIVCDESVSALDVSVQAQVLNLLNDLKKEFGFTIVFISHDLSVVHYFCDRIMVMHKGKIVESGSADDVYERPKEAYTKRLIGAIPKVNMGMPTRTTRSDG